jgi:polar amino acid transport system ATP-binding protein/putative ABC transport system ATP-binding protein
MIECKNISLSFSDKMIFNHLTLSVAENENVCLSAVSGKGKTTFLKLLQGYVIPDDGEIYINNIALQPSTIKDIRDIIVWIPQNVNLPVNNGAGLIKLLNIQSNRDEIEGFTHKLGLEKNILTKDFDIISGGQKQRIIISICLSFDKKIILLDEPTSSLDKTSISSLIEVIHSLKGKTILSASHNQQWINSMNRTISL